jgi:hypothetical protein
MGDPSALLLDGVEDARSEAGLTPMVLKRCRQLDNGPGIWYGMAKWVVE